MTTEGSPSASVRGWLIRVGGLKGSIALTEVGVGSLTAKRRTELRLGGGGNSVFIQESSAHVCRSNWPRLVDQSEPLRTWPAAAGTRGQLRAERDPTLHAARWCCRRSRTFRRPSKKNS